jgi:CRP-like cAMP-binding protein/Pyruvate/2-oxoacid:ferredoxin oxidoreductase delta subunit
MIGKTRKRADRETRAGAVRRVEADDLLKHSNPRIREAFEGVARPFLRWNALAVVSRTFNKGDVICREGDYGRTAFMIEKGAVKIFLKTSLKHATNEPKKGLFSRIGRFRTVLRSRSEDQRRDEDRRPFIDVGAPVPLPYGKPVATMTEGDLFGEMTCMNHYPRSATVVAEEDGTQVLEMLRNMLYIMQRNPSFRRRLEKDYSERAIDNHLRSVELFASLWDKPAEFDAFANWFRSRVRLRRCEPGEVIFQQGAPPFDGFYLVRTGFVKVTQSQPGGERVLNYIGPGKYIGEIALLSGLPELRDLAPAGVRTATCTALDHVDLVRIAPEDFQEILRLYPHVAARVVSEARERLIANRQALHKVQVTSLDQFLSQGLNIAAQVLVLDLEKCTRCDECTKACADTHEGVTRLVREGLRFDKFLVASSCRSCLDPYCLVGCPVGSISRDREGVIQIADWCIGCGLCAANCPYGNINMIEEYDGEKKAYLPKATTCDLCKSLGEGSEPSCVYACPHDAAHRMKGSELLKIVQR